MSEILTQSIQPKKRVALAVSGGIAAYKAVEVLRGLQKAGCQVFVAMTKNACEFVAPLTFRALSDSPVIVDDFSPQNSDPIAHINFSQTVDLFLVAPATANVIAKFANGIADDFVTSTYLASTAPVLIAPAMNTTMWNHPATQRNVDRLRRDGVFLIEPESGEMACRTIGPGRLAEPDIIVAAALDLLRRHSTDSKMDLAGEHFLITSGATREYIDPVRYITNRSSGRMGFAIAEAALGRGASVTVVAGATTATRPAGATFREALSAREMLDAVETEIPHATVFIGAAAVADYRPALRESEKIKKSDQDLLLTLERNPDILATVGLNKRPELLVVGFAAETNDVERNALKKLHSKNLDMIIANDVTLAGAGFDTETNVVTIISRGISEPLVLPILTKREVADRILDEVLKLRRNLNTDGNLVLNDRGVQI
jgi:phosphopantothenoylcysteine decarboxylase/phosphopantothenate--cysteine ligase